MTLSYLRDIFGSSALCRPSQPKPGILDPGSTGLLDCIPIYTVIYINDHKFSNNFQIFNFQFFRPCATAVGHIIFHFSEQTIFLFFFRAASCRKLENEMNTPRRRVSYIHMYARQEDYAARRSACTQQILRDIHMRTSRSRERIGKLYSFG